MAVPKMLTGCAGLYTYCETGAGKPAGQQAMATLEDGVTQSHHPKDHHALLGTLLAHHLLQ